jgi:lipopolysaccharide export system protein LptC
MRTFISLIIVLALALFSFWFQDLFRETPIVQLKKDTHFPDYFMENFSITSLNAQGEPAYILQARRLEHFADDDSAEIQQPVIEFRGEQDDWIISAERASILTDKTMIHLYENVRIRRKSIDDHQPLRIDTEYLKINTASKIAETHQPAQIISAGLQLNSRGMMFDNNKGIVKLMSEVKGHYAPAK